MGGRAAVTMLDMATSKGEAGGGEHRGKAMVRIPADVFDAMRRLADKNDRPLTREIRQALIAWLESKGEWPPPGGAPEPKKRGRPRKPKE